MSNSLHMLIWIDDALNAIGEHQSLDEFVLVHKSSAQEQAKEAYLAAVNMIQAHGTRRKAINFVQQEINKFR